MENSQSTEGPQKKNRRFRFFAVKSIVIGTVGVLALLWLASYVLNIYETHDTANSGAQEKAVAASHTSPAPATHGSETGHEEMAQGQESHGQAASGHDPAAAKSAENHDAQTAKTEAHQTPKDAHATAGHDGAQKDEHADPGHGTTDKDTHTAAGHDGAQKDEHADPGHDTTDKNALAAAGHGDAQKNEHADTGHGTADKDAQATTGHGDAQKNEHASSGDADGGGHGSIPVSDVSGVTFVMATMAPLHYELEERFYGWQPNDVIRPADDVKNFQLGVLEVTRRTVEALTERISRTGSAQAFDKDLEKARNNMMINADDYMMPSAESSYSAALKALESYKTKLENGTAPFFTRTVNLIPLLESYESLLGSCDDNLTKAKEDDGREVSWFKADDYFYYAQGVASAMQTILQAVAIDFDKVIESRRGDDVLHHALESLHHAVVIDPLIILDGDPGGFTANHRANLAAAISHARFYVGLLIQTLST